MRALVTVASKHGSTTEIGAEIADVLRLSAIAVDEIRPENVASLADYEVIVCGSAVYMGRWIGSARDFVHQNAETLRDRQVWLFSSGPLKGADDPADSAEGRRLLELIGGRQHRLFPGALNKDDLGFGERSILRLVKSPYGDYRDWGDIRAWAEAISADIKALPAAIA